MSGAGHERRWRQGRAPQGPLAGRISSLAGRRWTMPIIVLLVLLVIVAGAIIISSVTRKQVHLDDGTVWVTSLKDRKAARFNVRIKDTTGALTSQANRFDLIQQGSDTVLNEGVKATRIDQSTLAPDGRAQTKDSTLSAIGGGSIAFLNTRTGDLWAGKAADLNTLDPSSGRPQMKLGTGGKMAVSHDGRVYGYRPSDGMVLVLDQPDSHQPRQWGSLSDQRQEPADDFTVIGDQPVLTSSGRIIWKGGQATTGSKTRLRLQAPPTDDQQQGWVAAADNRGIYTLALRSGNQEVSSLMTTGMGEAAKPVSTSGCVHGAWAQKARNYISLCQAAQTSAPFKTLQSVSASSDLVFRTNHRLVVLNDVLNGNIWNPQDSTDVIKIQWKTLQTEKTDQRNQDDKSAKNHRNFNKTCSAQSGQIKANDDGFGARVGGQQILDVLRNDEQTDCSVLQISKVSPPAGADISVSPVYNGRYLQLDASSASAGTASVTYDISDGRGQSSTAKVTIRLTGNGDNHAPRQTDMPPEYDVEQGASFTANALGSFSDPDGDPLTLVSAAPQNSDQVVVSTRADGQLVFHAGSMSAGRVGIELTVSDGQATGSGLVYFSVRPANTLPAQIDGVVQQAVPDVETTVDLKPYIHGSSIQPATLGSVTATDGATVSMNAADLTFSFRTGKPGTYYLPYTVMQGAVEAAGLARIEVQPASSEGAKPIAANDVALLGADRTAIVEPLANDVDPMGGVLSVTSVTADPSLGIRTGLVSHKRVYLTASQVPTKPVTISYTVANAAGSSKGSIILQPPALSTGRTAPKASNINLQVRTGGIVSTEVLDHVSHADGTTVKLKQDLQTDPKTFKGLAFASGNSVRYQASDTPGSYQLTYTVVDNLGNAASAQVTIAVHEKNPDNKPAPTPKDTQAQVAAGQKVRIPITLTGIDQDGDDDVLQGLGNTVPKLGRVSEVGANYLVYEAYADSSGTDSFSYAVEDWTGQRAQAQVRVGIFKGASDSGVYARDDQVVLQPNTAATVPVAQNDISGDNNDLTVSKDIQAQGIEEARVVGNTIAFTTPAQAGTSYVVYRIHDKAGLTDTATLTITTDPSAPIEPPTAYDYRIPASATIDKRTVDVDLGPWIANPSGTADELELGVDSSATGHARVKGGAQSRVISVDLTDQARAVPYTVTNTTHKVTSTAFIQVPAYGVFPPTLRPKAPALKVNARESLTINIADYVRVGAGKMATVESPDSVTATKAANSDLYKDEQTLSFTAPKDYAGPASISFTAVDGKRDKDKKRIINSAVLTLPITVIGRNMPPPTFSSTTVDVTAGEEATAIDLKALTHSPGSLYEDEKEYTYSCTGGQGSVTASCTAGGKLTLKASRDARPGEVSGIPVAINYGKGMVSAGITARVVQSNRPLARVPDQALRLKAGSSQSVRLFDQAFNPFPDGSLKAVRCSSGDSSGLKVNCQQNGTISISAAPNIGASSNTVLVAVQDDTKSVERQVTASIRVSVVDKPDQPLLSPVAGQPADSSITLSWTPGSANGSPIDEYLVEWGGGSTSCGTVTSCQITGLTNGQEYSFTVKAHNEVGWSKPSAPVRGKPDKVPTAPGRVRAQAGYQKVSVSWDRPSFTGTAVDRYTVVLTGGTGSWTAVTGGSTSVDFNLDQTAIADGSSFSATVTAHNAVGDGPASAASAAVVPWSEPDKPGITLSQRGDLIHADLQLGNLHNAGCRSITVSQGSSVSTLACSATSHDFTIAKSQYFTPLTVSVQVESERAGVRKVGNSAQITPTYDIHQPKNVQVANPGKGSSCTVTWEQDGQADDFTILAAGRTHPHVTATSFTTALAPWQSCSPSVSQNFNGHTGAPAQPSNGDVVNKVKARINTPQVAWNEDPSKRAHLTISGGTVTSYDQPGTSISMVITLGGNKYSYPWAPGQGDLDTASKPGLPLNGGADYKMYITVANGDPDFDATSAEEPIAGSPAPPTPLSPLASSPSGPLLPIVYRGQGLRDQRGFQPLALRTAMPIATSGPIQPAPAATLAPPAGSGLEQHWTIPPKVGAGG
ncbi:AAA family ATPase [Bifidobacterium aemilianum]|uniref:AAA family ATPase n=2 Tax=Bifidobacterium aemilianum TaxID=2493120 RepID=A0A366K7F7_9BIFI|nr:tandem-95 repeat protein [Bifidobacterium aemilianum]RBP97182.1 AAA family ATPase [Bifidobacterium aemilianum]